jgi:hypothetical protein
VFKILLQIQFHPINIIISIYSPKKNLKVTTPKRRFINLDKAIQIYNMDKARAVGNLGKKNILNDDKFIKQVTTDEEKYSKYLDDFNASPVETPLDILVDGMGNSTKLGFKDVNDAVDRQFLIMNEAHKAVMGKEYSFFN